MSKTKTKRARREQKREAIRKTAAHHRKATTAAAAKPTKLSQPSAKKQKPTPNAPPLVAAAPAKPHTQASQKHEIPFGTYENILLIGEGDFSFTKSLVLEHGCANVTATSFDTEDQVREKYPGFADTHTELVGLMPPVPFHYGVDATKLGSYKQLRGEEPYDVVAFMFPHTGGLSTDVNRQVRANQALLAGFFAACLSQHKGRPLLKNDGAGKVLVALFEGQPYELWNVRDLARSVGLRVVASWRFDWDDYPGYAHVRTLGSIEGGGAWKGEDRRARMYEFVKVEEGSAEEGNEKTKGKGKRKRGDDESGTESDDG